MTLTLNAAATAVRKLNQLQFAKAVQDYVAARKAKAEADKASREADAAAKQLQAFIEAAMDGEPVVVCGNAILSWKNGKSADASLTLSNGAVIPWSMVTSILVGNTTYPRDQVATLYGGRAGSHVLNVEGSP